jgi:hypothetical protein
MIGGQLECFALEALVHAWQSCMMDEWIDMLVCLTSLQIIFVMYPSEENGKSKEARKQEFDQAS